MRILDGKSKTKTNKWLEFHGEEKILNPPRSNIMLSPNSQQQHNPPRDSLRKSFKQAKPWREYADAGKVNRWNFNYLESILFRMSSSVNLPSCIGNFTRLLQTSL